MIQLKIIILLYKYILKNINLKVIMQFYIIIINIYIKINKY